MKAIIYLFGTLIVLAGVIYGLMMVGVPQPVLIVVGLIILGVGLVGASKGIASSKTISQTTADSSGQMKTTETKVSGDTL